MYNFTIPAGNLLRNDEATICKLLFTMLSTFYSFLVFYSQIIDLKSVKSKNFFNLISIEILNFIGKNASLFKLHVTKSQIIYYMRCRFYAEQLLDHAFDLRCLVFSYVNRI